MITSVLLWSLIGFLSGSIPYSLLVGRLILRRDIRSVGDANPGAFNVMKAGGGTGVFLAAALLDGFKGAIPVGLAHFAYGIEGWWILPVALAPALGHAYSPWLKFQGGKAIAVTFGDIAGLTIYEGPMFMGLLLGIYFYAIKSSGWAVAATCSALMVYWLLAHPDQPELAAVWLLHSLLLLWKYREDLAKPIEFRESYRQRIDKLLRRA